MYLHEDPQAFHAAVLSCAEALGMSPVFVDEGNAPLAHKKCCGR